MQNRLWTKNFIISFTANTFFALVYFLQITTLAEYSVKTFSTNASIAGLTATVNANNMVMADVKESLRDLTKRLMQNAGAR